MSMVVIVTHSLRHCIVLYEFVPVFKFVRFILFINENVIYSIPYTINIIDCVEPAYDEVFLLFSNVILYKSILFY